MKTSNEIAEIAQAMARAQNKIKPALKDGLNPHFKSKYMSISSVWESLREPMTSNNLTIWQDVTTSERGVSVETRIVHSSGQWVEFGPLVMPVGKADAQGFGSCISYAKRYALCAAIGIVSSDEDDDASSAVDRATGEVKQSSKSDEIKKAIETHVPHTPLTTNQQAKIIGLTEAISDKAWISDLAKKAGVAFLTDVSAERFAGLIANLEKKVGG